MLFRVNWYFGLINQPRECHSTQPRSTNYWRILEIISESVGNSTPSPNSLSNLLENSSQQHKQTTTACKGKKSFSPIDSHWVYKPCSWVSPRPSSTQSTQKELNDILQIFFSLILLCLGIFLPYRPFVCVLWFSILCRGWEQGSSCAYVLFLILVCWFVLPLFSKEKGGMESDRWGSGEALGRDKGREAMKKIFWVKKQNKLKKIIFDQGGAWNSHTITLASNSSKGNREAIVARDKSQPSGDCTPVFSQ